MFFLLREAGGGKGRGEGRTRKSPPSLVGGSPVLAGLFPSGCEVYMRNSTASGYMNIQGAVCSRLPHIFFLSVAACSSPTAVCGVHHCERVSGGVVDVEHDAFFDGFLDSGFHKCETVQTCRWMPVFAAWSPCSRFHSYWQVNVFPCDVLRALRRSYRAQCASLLLNPETQFQAGRQFTESGMIPNVSVDALLAVATATSMYSSRNAMEKNCHCQESSSEVWHVSESVDGRTLTVATLMNSLLEAMNQVIFQSALSS